MGELARNRRGRDLHLSRGHIAATAVAVCTLALTSFLLGMRVGSGPTTPAGPTHFTGQVADGELVALLARVETAADVNGGVGEMTFPSALTASSGGGVADSEPRPRGAFHIEVARFADVAKARTLRDHLREAGEHAWVAAELRGGVMAWRVAVGGYEGRASADAAMGQVEQALQGWAGASVSPRIVSR